MVVSNSLNPHKYMYSFKDVILTNHPETPPVFEKSSRKEVEIFDVLEGFAPEYDITFVPIIPAPMAGMLNYIQYIKYVGSMFTTLNAYIPITIPRFPSEVMTPEVRFSFVQNYHRIYDKLIVITAVGINSKEEKELVHNLLSFYQLNKDYLGVILFDVSNGYHEKLISTVKETISEIEKRKLGNVMVMYGNFMGEPPYKNSKLLYRYGIGGGRVCSTRLKSSTGGPSLWSAIRSLSTYLLKDPQRGYPFFYIWGSAEHIIDGGVSQPSYVPIALAVGTPMIGSLFLRTEINIANNISSMYRVPMEFQGVLSLRDFEVNYMNYVSALRTNVNYFLDFIQNHKGFIYEIENIPEIFVGRKKVIVGSSLFSSKGLSEFPEGVVKILPAIPLYDVLRDIRHAVSTAFSLVGSSELPQFRENVYLIRVNDGEWFDRNYSDDF